MSCRAIRAGYGRRSTKDEPDPLLSSRSRLGWLCLLDFGPAKIEDRAQGHSDHRLFRARRVPRNIALELPGKNGIRRACKAPLVCTSHRKWRLFVRLVTGGAFPRKVGGENRTVTAGRRPWWPRMAGLQPLSTRAFGPRLRRLTALTALATRPLIATKRSTARCGQSVCKCHAEKFRSAIFARILTAVHTAARRLTSTGILRKQSRASMHLALWRSRCM